MRQMISGLILSARSKVGLKDPWYSNEAESANQLLKSHNYNVNSQKLGMFVNPNILHDNEANMDLSQSIGVFLPK